jgi:hypothetical protein
VVVSQKAFSTDPEKKKTLDKYPISHLVELPALKGKAGELICISEFLLPFALNFLAAAMAAARSEGKNLA